MMTREMAKRELVEIALELLKRNYDNEEYISCDNANEDDDMRELDAFTELTRKRINYLASQL